MGFPAGQRWIDWVALTVVVAAAALPRLNHIDKSIWTPEAWVANSVLCDSMREMFHYKDWLQTSPPLFLMLLRGVVRLTGVSVASLRAVPFLFSMLSLVLIAWLAKKLLTTPFAVICTALVALSPPAVVFSKEVKHFSADMAATCLLLVMCWEYLEHPDRKRYVRLFVALGVSLFLSYTALTFVPVALVLLATTPISDANGSNDRKHRLQRTGVIALMSGVICALNYWLFIKPNTSPLLTQYWSDGYPQFNSFTRVVRFYVRDFLGMGLYFYLPITSKGSLSSILPSSGVGIILLFLGGMIGVSVATFGALKLNKRHAQVLALCLGPYLCLAVLNLFRLYPVSSRRLTLFLVPCISLAAAILLQNIWDTILMRMSRSTINRLSLVITAACVLTVALAAVHSEGWGNYWFEDEDTAGALRYLRSRVAEGDTVYVHASIEEPVKLYFRVFRWIPADVRYGNTGHPCCTRNNEPSLPEADAQREYVLRDFEHVLSAKPVTRLWLVSTGRNGHWEELGRNELEMIDQYLAAGGCRKDGEEHFAYEIVQAFDCAPPDFNVAN